jgi:hypothetical protein
MQLTDANMLLLYVSTFIGEIFYVDGWLGAWRHLKYGMSELPLYCS